MRGREYIPFHMHIQTHKMYTVTGAGKSRVYPAACEGDPRQELMLLSWERLTSSSGKPQFVCVRVNFFFFNLYWSIVALQVAFLSPVQ